MLCHQKGKVGIFRAKIRLFAVAVGFQLTGCAFHHLLKMSVVPVYNADPAVPQEFLLALHVFLEAGMFIRSDMIRLYIGKNAIIKIDSGDPVHLQCLGRYLHDHAVKPGLHHLRKIFIDQI